ncbi:MAG: hypothetical protein M3R45_02255 [Pseudomonadota bacterium]|nr:hypothetical protein [Pseudomonadota bacterium]
MGLGVFFQVPIIPACQRLVKDALNARQGYWRGVGAQAKSLHGPASA